MRAERSSSRLSSSATLVGFGSLRFRAGAGVCEEHGFLRRWHLQTKLALLTSNRPFRVRKGSSVESQQPKAGA